MLIEVGKCCKIEVIKMNGGNSMMNERVQSVVDNLEIIKQLYDKPAFITVIDKDGVVAGYSIPKGEKPKLNVGDVFEDPSGAFDRVIREGIRVYNYLPKEVMGEAFEGYLVPIKDGGKVVGCLISTYPADEKEKIKSIAEQFKGSVKNIDSSVQEVISGTENLVKMLEDMNTTTASVETDVNGAADIVNNIGQNASHSNILALNASIEAARSGDAGKGFAVVADEMGKLAKDSGSCAKEIKETLSGIVNHLGEMVCSIKEANDVAKNYMESIHSIKSVLEETISLADQLEEGIK